MCGIAGILNISGHLSATPDMLGRMISSMRHRGPEDTGIYLDNTAGLAHARLNIIDLSCGTQPIHTEDKRYWIVFNGEIFNYPELREWLEARGHTFVTSSDTETIIHLYEEKGPSCLDDLIGQFAFAIWDARERELFLARDRVGIRPLHYVEHDGTLLFASEAKALFATGLVSPDIDPISLDQVFTFWTTLPGRTIFKNIHELPQGHYMVVRNGHISVRRYWDIPAVPDAEKDDSPAVDIVERIKHILLDAVRIRLRADVPVGAYLSGGLDSSGITSLITNNFNNNLETFGIRFEEQAFDEGAEQKLMARSIGVNHHELVATNDMLGKSFQDVVWFAEKPLLRTAPVPLFLLSDEVQRNNLKVVLTGEGADEVFGGYNIFRENKVRRFWATQPDSTARPALLLRLYPYIFNDRRVAPMLKHFFAQGLEQTDDPLYSHMIRWLNTSRTKAMFSDEMRNHIGSYNGIEDLRFGLPTNFAQRGSFEKAQYLEMSIFMSNYLLSSQGDRVAMAHSLEIRLPYLDHRLIEYMSWIPAKWKIHGLKEKYILKESFRGVLPDRIISRPKNPYRAPISQGLLNQDTCALFHDIELPYFDKEYILAFLDRISDSSRVSEVDNMGLAGLLSTYFLYKQYVLDYNINSIKTIVPDRMIDHRTVPS